MGYGIGAMANRKIVVVGSSNTDMIIKAPRIPKPGETVLGGQFSMAAGGKGAIQAVAAARAGGEVVFIARVGADFFGERAIKSFNADRIDSSLISRDREMPSGIALVFVGEDGQNSIAVAPGANAKLSRADIEGGDGGMGQKAQDEMPIGPDIQDPPGGDAPDMKRREGAFIFDEILGMVSILEDGLLKNLKPAGVPV